MNLDLPPLAREIKQLCHDFAAKEIREQAAGWWEREEFPSDVFLKLGELDLMGMLVPEQWGGSEAGMLAFVAGMEELPRRRNYRLSPSQGRPKFGPRSSSDSTAGLFRKRPKRNFPSHLNR